MKGATFLARGLAGASVGGRGLDAPLAGPDRPDHTGCEVRWGRSDYARLGAGGDLFAYPRGNLLLLPAEITTPQRLVAG